MDWEPLIYTDLNSSSFWVKAWSPTVLSPLPKRSQRRWSPNQQTRKLRFSPSIDFSMALLGPYSIRTASEWSPGILPVFLPGHDSMSHPMPRVVDLLSYWSVPPLILKMVAGGCQHGYRRLRSAIMVSDIRSFLCREAFWRRQFPWYKIWSKKSTRTTRRRRRRRRKRRRRRTRTRTTTWKKRM